MSESVSSRSPQPPSAGKGARRGMIVGGVLMTGPLFSVLLLWRSMANANATLGQSGIGDPSALSHHLSMGIYGVFGGAVAFIVGLIVLIVSLVLWFQQKKTAEMRTGGPA